MACTLCLVSGYKFSKLYMNIQVSFDGVDSSDSLKEKISEKLLKYEDFLSEATNIQVVFRENTHSRGVDKDFRMDVNIVLPKASIRVEESGANMYEIIDKSVETIGRRLRRYHDKRKNWSGEIPWRVLEAEEAMNALKEEESDYQSYRDYIPKITVRKQINDLTPMSEGEAIEKMELLGYKQILFKNKNTGKISMIYSRDSGGYGLVEPSDSLDISN